MMRRFEQILTSLDVRLLPRDGSPAIRYVAALPVVGSIIMVFTLTAIVLLARSGAPPISIAACAGSPLLYAAGCTLAALCYAVGILALRRWLATARRALSSLVADDDEPHVVDRLFIASAIGALLFFEVQGLVPLAGVDTCRRLAQWRHGDAAVVLAPWERWSRDLHEGAAGMMFMLTLAHACCLLALLLDRHVRRALGAVAIGCKLGIGGATLVALMVVDGVAVGSPQLSGLPQWALLGGMLAGFASYSGQLWTLGRGPQHGACGDHPGPGTTSTTSDPVGQGRPPGDRELDVVRAL